MPDSAKVSKEALIQLYRQALQANVPLDSVEAKVGRAMKRIDTVQNFEELSDRTHFRSLTKIPLKQRLTGQVLPVASVLLGCFLIGSVVVPISQSMFVNESQNKMLAPIPTPMVLVPSQVQASSGNEGQPDGDAIEYKPKVVATELDYTNLSNWFPNLNLKPSENEKELEYQLDIPAIKIENARIRVGGTNLDHSLIQYPGTAKPGELGSPVIFGHSVLRQFYNPSLNNPRRYFSIFSTIMTLKPGDEIFITHDNVRYKYLVKKKDVVKPEDTFILEQSYDARRLKLVTCFPEGTYKDRGVITAELATGQ